MSIQMIRRHAGMLFAGAILASMVTGAAAVYAYTAAETAVNNTAETAAETAFQSSSDDYIFPQSSYDYLNSSDFAGKTKEELRRGRNEIYARHGRRFNDKSLQWYFDSRPWYHGTVAPGDFRESVLNDWEKENISRIQQAENGTYKDRPTTAAADHQVKALTADELKAMQRLLIPRYAGFFTCTYSDPQDIIWGSVFYSGFDGRDVNDYQAVVKEFEAVTGEEVFTDVTAIKRSEVEAIVRETTGTEYSQAKHPLDGDWVWLPGLQAYAYEHGDTNLVGIEFSAGEYDGDELHLYYPVPDSFYYDTGVSEQMVTLRKNGSGGWWFCSNGAK